MKMNLTKVAVFGLISLMTDLRPAFAATLTTIVNGGIKSSCTYSSYSADSAGNLIVTCSAAAGGATPSPSQVPQCSLSSSLPSIVKGATANLTVSCNPAATSYTWTNAGVATTVSPGVVVSPVVTTTYTVVGVNAAGSSNPATLTLPVSQPPPLATIPNNCTIIPVTWNSGYKYNTTPWHNLTKDQMIAFRMVVPAGKGVGAAGTAYGDVPKTMSISKNPCDFSAQLAQDRCMGSGDNDPLLYNGPGKKPGAYCHTTEGDVIYYNIKNTISPNNTDPCPAGKSCRFSFYY